MKPFAARAFPAVLLMSSITAPTSLARTTATVTLKCPIGGERFTARLERSGVVQCRRFDFKRIGPVMEPPSLPECPSNGFVMFTETMSDADIKKLTPWVLSHEYQTEVRPHAPYYRVARTHEYLGRKPDLVGWHLLQASWQVERTDPGAYAQYVRAAIEEFDRYLATNPGSGGATDGLGAPTAHLLGAELSRRVGDISEAKRRLDALIDSQDDGPLRLAARALLALVEQGDTEAHAATWNADPLGCEAILAGEDPNAPH